MQSDHALPKRNQMAFSAINSKDVLFKGGPATFVQQIKMDLEKKLL